MSDNDTRKNGEPARDEAVEKELEGVPEEFLNDAGEAEGDGDGDDKGDAGDAGDLNEALAALRADLDAAKQDVLYARADTQNVRRRLEKDVQDARNYAATGFARDILSVADNLSRALDHVPAGLREDEQARRFVNASELFDLDATEAVERLQQTVASQSQVIQTLDDERAAASRQ